MGGDGMVNFFYKPFLEFGQEAPGGDNVIRVIPPVNGLKACQVFQEVLFLLEDLQRICLNELAGFNLFRQFGARLHSQGHGGDLLWFHNVEQPCGCNNMLPGALPTPDPEDDGHKDVDACGFGLDHTLFGLLRGQPLLDPLEGKGVSGFQSSICHRQARLLQRGEVFDGFTPEIIESGVEGYFRAFRERLGDLVQDLQEELGFQCQHVPVDEEDRVNMGYDVSCVIDVLKNIFDLPDTEPFVVEHATEGAFVVSASECTLYQQAVGLHLGSVDFPFVSHVYFLNCYCPFLR